MPRRSASRGRCADLGLRRGDLVALAIDDAEAFLTALYGASLAGLLPASLHPPGATRDLDSYCALTAGVLRASGARALVTSGRVVERFDRERGSCPKLEVVVAYRRPVCSGPAASRARPARPRMSRRSTIWRSCSSPPARPPSRRAWR